MKYKSEIYKVIHHSATEKFAINAISETRMREYDEMCLASEADVSLESKKVPQKTNSMEMEDIGLATT